jgi:hypothetical protein
MKYMDVFHDPGRLPQARMGLDPAAGAEDPLISQAHGRELSPV